MAYTREILKRLQAKVYEAVESIEDDATEENGFLRARWRRLGGLGTGHVYLEALLQTLVIGYRQCIF